MELNDADTLLIVYVAKGFTLFGQGNHQDATEAFDFALRNCDDDARSFVEVIKVILTMLYQTVFELIVARSFIILFEVEHRDEVEVIRYETDPTDYFLDIKSIRSAVKVSARSSTHSNRQSY